MSIQSVHLEICEIKELQICLACGELKAPYKIVYIGNNPFGTLCSGCVLDRIAQHMLGGQLIYQAYSELNEALLEGRDYDIEDMSRLKAQLAAGMRVYRTTHSSFYEFIGEDAPSRWEEDPATDAQQQYIKRLSEKEPDLYEAAVEQLVSSHPDWKPENMTKGQAGYLIKVMLREKKVAA